VFQRGGKPIGTAAAKAKAEGKPSGKAKYSDDMRITVLLKKNPHREDSAAGKRFALFKTRMTVGEWRKKAIAAKLAQDGHGHLRVHVRAGHVKVA
jgi:hypothetical protein